MTYQHNTNKFKFVKLCIYAASFSLVVGFILSLLLSWTTLELHFVSNLVLLPILCLGVLFVVDYNINDWTNNAKVILPSNKHEVALIKKYIEQKTAAVAFYAVFVSVLYGLSCFEGSLVITVNGSNPITLFNLGLGFRLGALHGIIIAVILTGFIIQHAIKLKRKL